jgi:hypothetical protein
MTGEARRIRENGKRNEIDSRVVESAKRRRKEAL